MSRFPPTQDFTVYHVIDRSYDLTLHSLRNVTYAQQTARRVAKQSCDFEEPKRRFLRKRLTAQNRAIKTDLATYELMEQRKREWVSSKRLLPGDVVDRWILEAMADYALERPPIYMGVMIENVLFTYQNTQVQSVLEIVDEKNSTGHALNT